MSQSDRSRDVITIYILFEYHFTHNKNKFQSEIVTVERSLSLRPTYRVALAIALSYR